MTSLERTLTLTVPSATENLALIRDFVVNVGSQAGLGEDDVAKLELAVDEACANVIEHAHGHDSNKEVTVRATFDAATLRIEVVDEGQGFDPTVVPSTPVVRVSSSMERSSPTSRRPASACSWASSSKSAKKAAT